MFFLPAFKCCLLNSNVSAIADLQRKNGNLLLIYNDEKIDYALIIYLKRLEYYNLIRVALRRQKGHL